MKNMLIWEKTKMISESECERKRANQSLKMGLSKHMCVPTHARRNKVRYFISSRNKDDIDTMLY